MVPPPKRSRGDEEDSEDDDRLHVKDPKVYKARIQVELNTFLIDCERVFRTRSKSYRHEYRRADYAEAWIKPELAQSWNLKVEWAGDDYRTRSKLKQFL